MIKKLTKLTRMLLVAAGLCVGQNAWTQTIYSWAGAASGAVETGGTAAGTLNQVHNTVAGNLYAMTISGSSNDLSSGGVTIALNNALQAGDIIRVTGFQDKNEAGKATALYISFDQDATNKGNISDNENWVNLNTTTGCANAEAPEVKEYTVTAALAGSNKLTLIRTNGKTSTNLFINKFQIVRPVVNVDINFDGATITDKTITGVVSSMSWKSHTQWSPEPSIADNMLRFGNTSGCSIPLSGEIGTKDKVVFSFDLGAVGLSGKKVYFNVYDTAGNAIISEGYQPYDNTAVSNLNTLGFDFSKFVKDNANNPGMTSTKNTITITIDYGTKQMYGSVVNKNGTFNTDPITLSAGTKAVGSIEIYAQYNTADRFCYLDNVLVKTIPGDYSAETADYTLRFKYGETEIKEAVVSNGDVGEDITVSDVDKEPIWYNDEKYIYVSDNSQNATILSGGSAEVTLTFRKAVTWNYTVKAVDGSSNVLNANLASGSVIEGESATIAYPQYILSGTILYSINNNTSGDYYRKSVTPTSVDYETTLTYNGATVSDVVYYTEAEDVEGLTISTNGNITNRSSNAKCGYSTENVTLTKLPAGKYKLAARIYKNNSGIYKYTFTAGENNIEFTQNGATNGANFTSNEFTLKKTTDIILVGGTSNVNCVDFIYIQKTGDCDPVAVTANDYGYKTFASDYDLDFSESTTKAYIASGENNGKITMQQVNKVPAGTGLFLQCANNENIPVLTTTADDVSENMLVRGTNEVIVKEEGFNKYVLGIDGSSVAFYLINEYAATVGTSQAYLKVSGNNARLAITFDDVSGIKDVETVKATTDGYYNLKGLRIAAPQKGLYIVNGKKIIMK